MAQQSHALGRYPRSPGKAFKARIPCFLPVDKTRADIDSPKIGLKMVLQIGRALYYRY